MNFELKIIVITVLQFAQLYALELPNFLDLKRFYPGYMKYGGITKDKDMNDLLPHVEPIPHHTSGLRMSYTLNQIGGKHTIESDQEKLEDGQIKHYLGRDGMQYIQDPVMFGPFLETKYKTPEIYTPDKNYHQKILSKLWRRQGIVRLATFSYKKADARVALWDCNEFYQNRDWSTYRHIIALEFWEAPDSICDGGKNTTELHYQLHRQRPVRIRHQHKALRTRRHRKPQKT